MNLNHQDLSDFFKSEKSDLFMMPALKDSNKKGYLTGILILFITYFKYSVSTLPPL